MKKYRISSCVENISRTNYTKLYEQTSKIMKQITNNTIIIYYYMITNPGIENGDLLIDMNANLDV